MTRRHLCGIPDEYAPAAEIRRLEHLAVGVRKAA